MGKKGENEIRLKERYRTLSILESELPRNSNTKIGKTISKMMNQTLNELAELLKTPLDKL